MRKIIFIAVLFVSYFGFSQGGPKMNVAKFVGELTTTERNSLDVPTGERWLIWNATTEQFEHAGSDDVWSALTGVSSADEVSISDAGGYYTATDVEAALQEIASDVAAISDTDDQTASEVNITDSGGNYTGTTVEAALAEVADSISVKATISYVDDNHVNLTTSQDIGGIKTFTGHSTYFGSRVGFTPTSGWQYASGVPNIGFNDDENFRIVGISGSNIYTLDATNLTDERSYELPDKNGTIALTSDISGSGAVPDDTGSSNGDVLTTDGSGTYTWETPSGGGSSLPVDDTTALVQDPSDNTKQVRIDAGAITTGTTRTITMPDSDVDLDDMMLKTTYDTDEDGFVDNIDLNSVGTSAIIDGSVNTNDVSSQVLQASYHTIADAGDHYTGTTVEAMGQEIGDSLAVKVTGTISGRTGTDVTSVMLQTQAQFDSDGATSTGEVVFISDASPAEVVTSATIAMEGWKMYDDSSTDAATITLSDCDPGETLTVYINRASAPTLAGTDLVYNQLPNTTAFAAATDMMIIFEVTALTDSGDTVIDYYYVER